MELREILFFKRLIKLQNNNHEKVDFYLINYIIEFRKREEYHFSGNNITKLHHVILYCKHKYKIEGFMEVFHSKILFFLRIKYHFIPITLKSYHLVTLKI